MGFMRPSHQDHFVRNTLAALLLIAVAAPLRAQDGSATPWEQWFYGQRMQGLGYIPNDALVRAVNQRDSSAYGARSNSGGEDGWSYSALNEAAGPAAAITEGRWFEMGPSAINSSLDDMVSGRITSLAIDPRNIDSRNNAIYVAAAGGGVWKSTSRGARWTPLTDNLPSLSSGAVAVDPATGDVWYGTGELNFCRDCYYGAGVYRSRDGGANWTRVNPEAFLSSPTSLIAFDRRRPGTIFIGRSTALWKSSDNGQSWREVLRGAITDFAIHPADSNLAFAAVGNFSGSDDNGLYRTTDGGETWTRLSEGLPASNSLGRMSLSIMPSDPNVVYALIARSADFHFHGFFRSLNGGVTWAQAGDLPADLFSEDGQGQGLFNMLVRADPRVPGVVYAGGVKLWKSSDFGATWADLSTPARLHEDPRDVVFDPADPQSFYLISDSGVWRSSDGGRSFTNLNQSLGVVLFQSVALHPGNPNRAVGGTQDNGTALYTGSMLWEQGRPGDSGAVFYDRANPQTLYTAARRHSLRRSTDGGATFQLIAEGLDGSDRVQFYPPFLPDPTQPSTLYFATYRVWKSTNRGDLWTPLSGDLTSSNTVTISALAVSSNDSSVLWAGTSNGRVTVSRDGGQNWAPAAPLPNRFVTSIAVDPALPGRAIVAVSGFGSGHVFLTQNFGDAWEDISANLPDIPVNAALLDAVSPATVYLGTDIGVFVRLADGTWGPLKDGLPNVVVLGLAQNPATGLLAAATHGRGVFAIATGSPATSAPRISHLSNRASLDLAPAAPGMTSALFGANLAVSTASLPNNVPLPTTLAGASVLVNDIPAPLFSVSPTQINFQMPYGLTGNFALIVARNAGGEATLRVARVDAHPGIHLSGAEGDITHSNGARVTEASPARPGEELFLFASGLGPVTPAVTTGQPAPPLLLTRTISNSVVRVGNGAAEVRYSGLVWGYVGLYQINFVVPAGQTGRVPVRLETGPQSSNTVFISVVP